MANMLTCPKCGGSFEFLPKDVHTAALGKPYVTCPKCDVEMMIEDESLRKIITYRNISYPQDFLLDDVIREQYTDEEITAMVRDGLEKAAGHPGWHGRYGNIDVFILRYDAKTCVYVTQNAAMTTFVEAERKGKFQWRR